jgi:hypothetical protein
MDDSKRETGASLSDEQQAQLEELERRMSKLSGEEPLYPYAPREIGGVDWGHDEGSESTALMVIDPDLVRALQENIRQLEQRCRDQPTDAFSEVERFVGLRRVKLFMEYK